MTATYTSSSIAHLLWRGKWLIVLCAVVALAIAAVMLAMAEPLYRTHIRIQMTGQYASPETRRAVYDDFVRWRSRVMPPPAAPAGATITESYNPVAESAALVLTLPEEHTPFASAYYEGLTRSLESFSAAKFEESQRKLQLLTQLGETLPLQGSDHVATLATNLTFLIEDAGENDGFAAISPPTPSQPIRASVASSLIFALVIGVGTGIAFLISRSIWRSRAERIAAPLTPEAGPTSIS